MSYQTANIRIRHHLKIQMGICDVIWLIEEKYSEWHIKLDRDRHKLFVKVGHI